MLIAEPLSQAIISAQESLYGFSFVDLGFNSSDLENFEHIQIENSLFYNSFGVPSSKDLFDFLVRIGPNQPDLIYKVALRIAKIAKEILRASERETLCLSLRSLTPTPLFDSPRWRMDGQYYKPKKKAELQYRFLFTFLGASSLFYPLSVDFLALRKNIWIQMSNRELMSQMFDSEKAFSPPRGMAALLIGGISQKAALHSEPPIHKPRLLLSLIPCSEEELKNLNGLKY